MGSDCDESSSWTEVVEEFSDWEGELLLGDANFIGPKVLSKAETDTYLTHYEKSDGEELPAKEWETEELERPVPSTSVAAYSVPRSASPTCLHEEDPIDDNWIFESLGVSRSSPIKKRSHFGSPQRGAMQLSEPVTSSERQILARNMRRLLITARRQINALNQRIEVLDQQVKARGAVKCPRCLHKFEEKGERIIPKYIKVIKGRCTLELEFASFEKLKEWLVMNRHDFDADGLPTLIHEEKPPEKLDVVGSRLRILLTDQRKKNPVALDSGTMRTPTPSTVEVSLSVPHYVDTSQSVKDTALSVASSAQKPATNERMNAVSGPLQSVVELDGPPVKETHLQGFKIPQASYGRKDRRRDPSASRTLQKMMHQQRHEHRSFPRWNRSEKCERTHNSKEREEYKERDVCGASSMKRRRREPSPRRRAAEKEKRRAEAEPLQPLHNNRGCEERRSLNPVRDSRHREYTRM